MPPSAALAVGARGVAVAAPSGDAVLRPATPPRLAVAAAEGLGVSVTAMPVGVAGAPLADASKEALEQELPERLALLVPVGA